MLTAPSSGRFVNQSSFQSKKIIYNNYQQIMNWRFAAANNFSRELTAGFCIYQQQQQENNNNNNLEPATPSMLGVA